MRIVRHTALHFQRGTSDKVYEVDLCEVGAGEFVVNFRYGRRGAALREGSKTVLPVDRAKADGIFDKLVTAKKKKGYVDVTPAPTTSAPPAPVAPTPSPTPGQLSERDRTIVRYLAEPSSRPSDWPLPRIAWRAGELRIRAAAPHLATMLNGDGALAYSATWALGRLANPDYAEALRKRSTSGTASHTRRIAVEGLRACATPQQRDALNARWRGELPSSLAAALDDALAFSAALTAWVETAGPDRAPVFRLLYLIDSPSIRPGLLHQLRTLSLKPPNFKIFRQLLKAAEFRVDGQVFGTIARRISMTRQNYSRGYWSRGTVWFPGQGSLSIAEESAKLDSRLAYSKGTRTWLRRHVWRVLRRLAADQSADYVTLATGLLLAIADGDSPNPRQRRVWYWGTGERTTHYDRFANFWAVNKVLHGKSRRYEPRYASLSHVCVPPFEPGSPAPATREESYPDLWNARPEAMVTLLDKSACDPVHVFAARALRTQTTAWSLPTPAQLLGWLNSGYAITEELGADIAIARHDPANPDLELVAALCQARLDRARHTAHGWVRSDPSAYVGDSPFVVQLALSGQADSRGVIRDVLSTALLTPEQQDAHIKALLDALADIPDEDGPSDDAIREVATLITSAFGRRARVLDLAQIAELLQHERGTVQEVGARLLLDHETPAEKLPDAIIAGLMRSGYAPIRTIGLNLFGRLPDAVLLERYSVIVHLCANPHADVRSAVRPIIGRLAPAHPSFAASLFDSLLSVLTADEAFEGLHTDLVRLTREQLASALSRATTAQVWKLLQSPTGIVQELGGELLGTHVDASELTMRQLAELGSHDIRAVRTAVWDLYAANADRVRAELDEALRILDASWDDTRMWAFLWFEETLTSTDLTPTLLVSMCDGVRPDVQAFGRRMLTRHFEGEHGPEYLLKLSQHPATDMQLFATNYLERYAGGHTDRVERLVPYFTSVLSRVNKGRIAKQRVHAFLAGEAARDEASAQLIADILARVSASCAVQDRAKAIETLLQIATQYPSIAMPLTVLPTARRGSRAV
ncbi:MAG: hypothetical protein KC912_09070 [Proteobacteria bacterium]|nr:hypothetical protein [Pseudomonadota bacterium]